MTNDPSLFGRQAYYRRLNYSNLQEDAEKAANYPGPSASIPVSSGAQTDEVKTKPVKQEKNAKEQLIELNKSIEAGQLSEMFNGCEVRFGRIFAWVHYRPTFDASHKRTGAELVYETDQVELHGLPILSRLHGSEKFWYKWTYRTNGLRGYRYALLPRDPESNERCVFDEDALYISVTKGNKNTRPGLRRGLPIFWPFNFVRGYSTEVGFPLIRVGPNKDNSKLSITAIAIPTNNSKKSQAIYRKTAEMMIAIYLQQNPNLPLGAEIPLTTKNEFFRRVFNEVGANIMKDRDKKIKSVMQKNNQPLPVIKKGPRVWDNITINPRF